MAQLNTRGTLTRSRWDYFERTNGWASVYGSVAAGGIGAYFANNASGTMSLDVYHLMWFSSITAVWDIMLLPPPLTLTALTPADIQIHALQPDAATPPGVCGMYTNIAAPSYRMQRNSNAANTGTLAPVAGLAFVTLPPGWAIAVQGVPGSNPCELSMNVWFQDVLDNISPAI